jgi:hypothetical protein
LKVIWSSRIYRFMPICISLAQLTACSWSAPFYAPLGTGSPTDNIYGHCNFHQITKGMDFELARDAFVRIIAEMPTATRHSSLLKIRLTLGPQQVGHFTGNEVLVWTDNERLSLVPPTPFAVGGDLSLPFPKPVNFTVTAPDLVIDGRPIAVGSVRFEVSHETEFCIPLTAQPRD